MSASCLGDSYIGFDAVATSAEEVKNPKRDLPLGILGALSIVTLCYILMSLALVMMVPISALETGASFAAAFAYVGLPWAQYIVALGEQSLREGVMCYGERSYAYMLGGVVRTPASDAWSSASNHHESVVKVSL